MHALLSRFSSTELVSLLGTFCSLMLTWVLTRTNRWLREQVAHERQLTQQHIEREFARQNETVRTLSTAFAQGEPQTLDDLLSSAERDWSLTSFGPSSERELKQTPSEEIDIEVTEGMLFTTPVPVVPPPRRKR